MPKTVSPGKIELEHGSFEANVVPDVFDARDVDYRPRLQPLPNRLECRLNIDIVLTQEGNSCTGHAVAAMANAVLGEGRPTHASPYMAYALARRYDDYQGSADVGSSLRGALKGWALTTAAAGMQRPSPGDVPQRDVDNESARSRWPRAATAGGLLRVNTSRLDDLQSRCQRAHRDRRGRIHP